MWRAWLTLRLVLGWVYTLSCSAVASLSLLLGKPVWGWKLCLKPWARGTLRLVGVRLDLEGAEHLQKPAIYICNHQSAIDVVFVPALLPTTTRFVAKKELLRIPFWGWMLGSAGGIMIDRKNARGAVAAIREGIKALPAGWSVVVFPEGTRSEDGRLKPFKKGAFHMAIESGLPIVPVAFEGAVDVMPKHTLLVRPGTVFVTAGAPLDTSQWKTETIDDHIREAFRAMAHALARSRQRLVADRRQSGRPVPVELLHGSPVPGLEADGGYGQSSADAHSTSI